LLKYFKIIKNQVLFFNSFYTLLLNACIFFQLCQGTFFYISYKYNFQKLLFNNLYSKRPAELCINFEYLFFCKNNRYFFNGPQRYNSFSIMQTFLNFS